MYHPLDKEVLKMHKREIFANPNNFGIKIYKENAYLHLMFWFTNKKVMDVIILFTHTFPAWVIWLLHSMSSWVCLCLWFL